MKSFGNCVSCYMMWDALRSRTNCYEPTQLKGTTITLYICDFMVQMLKYNLIKQLIVFNGNLESL